MINKRFDKTYTVLDGEKNVFFKSIAKLFIFMSVNFSLLV